MTEEVRAAFEQSEHCRNEALDADGMYVDPLTAIHWLVFMAAYWATIETLRGMA